MQDDPKYNYLFIKEHAMFVWAAKIIPDELYRNSAQTFLIRHPEKAIKSTWRQTLEKFEDSRYDHMIKDELGFKEQYLMYEYITKELGVNALVIDADDLMKRSKNDS
eukprot:UN04144